uniref:PDZ domain-containing protein n=1 Tax=Cynoglossus semilaevis TaxID=244447 RepID=A0A3P8WYU3_CYNSE
MCTQEVMLTKSSKGLGFSFIMCELDPPTREFGSMVRIKQLFPGQPAEQSGRIQEGDVLLALNGQSLKELSYSVCELSLHTALTVVVVKYRHKNKNNPELKKGTFSGIHKKLRIQFLCFLNFSSLQKSFVISSIKTCKSK